MKRFLFLAAILINMYQYSSADSGGAVFFFGPTAHVNFGRPNITFSLGVEANLLVGYYQGGAGVDCGYETNFSKHRIYFGVQGYAFMNPKVDSSPVGASIEYVKEGKQHGIQVSVWTLLVSQPTLFPGFDFRYRRIGDDSQWCPGGTLKYFPSF